MATSTKHKYFVMAAAKPSRSPPTPHYVTADILVQRMLVAFLAGHWRRFDRNQLFCQIISPTGSQVHTRGIEASSLTSLVMHLLPLPLYCGLDSNEVRLALTLMPSSKPLQRLLWRSHCEHRGHENQIENHDKLLWGSHMLTIPLTISVNYAPRTVHSG